MIFAFFHVMYFEIKLEMSILQLFNRTDFQITFLFEITYLWGRKETVLQLEVIFEVKLFVLQE